MSVDVNELKKVVKKTRKKASSPVPNSPVIVVSRVNKVGVSTEVTRINPNSLADFARDNHLDLRACESILNRTYVNHEGYTFKVLPMAEVVTE